MAVLNLQEAAEQAGTSKVDIWRAIRSGELAAQRNNDGGFAIDPAELFRVFERQGSEQTPTQQNATASPEALGRPETSATPETAATNDMAGPFAALQAQLKSLPRPPAETQAKDELQNCRTGTSFARGTTTPPPPPPPPPRPPAHP